MLEFQRLSYAPVTRIYASGLTYNDHDLIKDLANILSEMRSDRAAGVRCVSLVDLSHAVPLNAKQRKMLMEWLKDCDALVPFISLGTVFFAPSPLVRGALTALFWFRPYPVPSTVVSDLDDAVRWAIQRLETSGLSVPERLRQELGRAFTPAGRPG